MKSTGRKETRSTQGIHGLTRDKAAALTDYFKLLANALRLKLIVALIESHELNVSDLCTRVGARIQAVSNALRLLEAAGLVTARRHGKNIFYRLVDEGVVKVIKLALTCVENGR